MATVICFAVLMVAEIVAHVVVLRYLKNKKSKKIWFISTILVFSALIIYTGYRIAFPPHIKIKTTGIYKVETEDYWVTEDKEDPYFGDGNKRQIQIRRYYPKGIINVKSVKLKPVVIASHGTFGTLENNISLYRELVSHGYEVIAVCHGGQSASMILENGKKIGPNKEFVDEINNLSPQIDVEEAYKMTKKWMKIRMDDLSYTMDDYLQKNSKECEFIALGHSLGAAAAYGITRRRNDVVACISLEGPFLYDIKGTKDGYYIFDESDYRVPILSIYSDSTWSHLREWKQYSNNVIFLDSSNPIYTNIYYRGVGHMGLCDLSMHSPLLAATLGGFSSVPARKQLKIINKDCMKFLEDNGF